MKRQGLVIVLFGIIAGLCGLVLYMGQPETQMTIKMLKDKIVDESGCEW